jgi:predicted RNase H-like nuclease
MFADALLAPTEEAVGLRFTLICGRSEVSRCGLRSEELHLLPYVGIDGFRGGWVAAWIDGEADCGFDYSSDLSRLLADPYKRVMIDIPIGLKSSGHRRCDVAARAWLGASVFLGARRNFWDFSDQASANRHYWQQEGSRMGISCQLWNIRDKIREVDEFMTPARQETIQETHPELIFFRLNGQVRLESKKTAAGRKQRIGILRQQGFRKISHWLMRRHGIGIGRDDLIDACACAIAARDANAALGEGERDLRGLRMEINYC